MKTQSNELFHVYNVENNKEQLLPFTKETLDGLKVSALSEGEIRDSYNLLVQFKGKYYLMQNSDFCDLDQDL